MKRLSQSVMRKVLHLCRSAREAEAAVVRHLKTQRGYQISLAAKDHRRRLSLFSSLCLVSLSSLFLLFLFLLLHSLPTICPRVPGRTLLFLLPAPYCTDGTAIIIALVISLYNNPCRCCVKM